MREEGEEVGVRGARNGRGGAGAASACVVGTESMVCARTVGDDKTDRRGPHDRGRGRARERAALTSGTELAEGDVATGVCGGKRNSADRRVPPRTEKERGRAGAIWAYSAKKAEGEGILGCFGFFFYSEISIPFSFYFLY
jgi:hypothetical protein